MHLLSEQTRKKIELATAVSRRHGKSFLRQAFDIARMKSVNPTLGTRDYYRFGLYDDQWIPSGDVGRFLGWRAEQELALALNPRTSVSAAWDKLQCLLIMHAHGLPVPALRAVFRVGPDLEPRIAPVTLRTPGALADWLRTGACWPVFAKPAWSQQSVGAHYFVGHDPAADMLLTKGGDRVPVEHFVSEVQGKVKRSYHEPQMGYLFQEALKPHARIVDLLANTTICGVRVVLIRDDEGVDVVRAIWRIATGDDDTDQYRDATSGHLFADVEIDTGRVRYALQRAWPWAQPIDRVPGTDRPLAGFALPDWDEAIALCRRASGLFPLMRIQHWDLALTDRGPCLLEVNDIGAISMPQSFGSGLLTDRVRRLLRTHGDAAKFPWIARLCA